MAETLGSETVCTKRQRIAMLAQERPEMSITTLAHHMDLGWLTEAYRQTRKDGAAGVDGVTATEYERDLEGHLRVLLDRAKSGLYRAPPVRRVYIPKGDGKSQRPLGIPTLDDKVLQRAVLMLLEPIYEQDFMEGSYGFRPGRSAHQALGALREPLMAMGGGWVVEVDIEKFFDTLDHRHLREFLSRRVRDGVVVRLIGKWLNAGVLEDGAVTRPSEGTPQGGVISPLLANIYLHYVVDEWFEREVKPRLAGRSVLVRYADDLVMGFAVEADARRVFEVLPKRFARYGLRLHPTKTRLVEFRHPNRLDRRGPAGGGTGTSAAPRRPGTFDFLGFTHRWGRSRRGYWVIVRQTARGRLSRALRAIGRWCGGHRHWPLAAQQETLSQKVRGHYAYYGITGNYRALAAFWEGVKWRWRRWLGRRSQRGSLSWEQYVRLLARYPLPRPVVVHSIFRPAASP